MPRKPKVYPRPARRGMDTIDRLAMLSRLFLLMSEGYTPDEARRILGLRIDQARRMATLGEMMLRLSVGEEPFDGADEILADPEGADGR